MNNNKLIRWVTVILTIYIIAFVTWWAILLIRTETKNYILQDEISLINNENYTKSEQIEQFERNKKMIIYEGIVFVALLMSASIYVLTLLQKQQQFDYLKRNFLLATTHELKTPLASLKLNLQAIHKKTLPIEKEELLINNSLKETERLNNLLNNILLASKIDAENYEFTTEPINLSNLLTAAANAISNRSNDIQLNVASNIFIKGDESSMRVIISNLIDNAIKYSKEGEVISIALKKNHNTALLTIADEGIGINPNDESKIWERFYRAEDERIRKTQGTGLGLFLVKSMVEINNGTINVQPNQPKGSIFTIQIPIYE